MDAFAGMTYPTSQSTKLCTLDDNLAIPDFEEDYGVDMASPHYDLGTLDKLPLELIGEILKTLDLRTLMDLRYANRRATEIINSIPQYKAIRKHAPNALRGILAIQTGRYITLEHLYEKLCTPECEVCGVAGSFLYLLTCKRACFFCFRKRSEFLPLQQTQAIKSFGIDRKFLKTLPCMRSVPGTYSIRMAKKGRSLLLFDTENVRQATIDLARAVSSNEHIHRFNLNGEVRGNVFIVDQSSQYEFQPIRLMAAVRAPWLNPASMQAEWGFHCVACRTENNKASYEWAPEFTSTSFRQHLVEFGEIRDEQHIRPAGTADS